jgi:hypothetical protein
MERGCVRSTSRSNSKAGDVWDELSGLHPAHVLPLDRASDKSGGERAAVQTLRDIQRRLAIAKRLECACLQHRFSDA